MGRKATILLVVLPAFVLIKPLFGSHGKSIKVFPLHGQQLGYCLQVIADGKHMLTQQAP